MSQPALFATAPRTDPTGIVHVLMPCMAYGCGRDMLDHPGDRCTVGTARWNQVTCPDCRSIGQAVLSAETARQQGRQA